MLLALQTDTLTELLLPLGVVLILASVMMSIRKRRKRAENTITAREQLEQSRQTKAMRGDLDQLMVELEQLTRRFSAQLDAKSIHMEKLLDAADQRIAQLKAFQADQSAAGTTSPSAAIEAASAPKQAAPPQEAEPATAAEDALSKSVFELADQGLSPMQIARELDEHVGKIELMLALRAST